MPRSAPEIAAKVLAVLQDLAQHIDPGAPPITPHDQLFALGFDSMDIVEAFTALSLDLEEINLDDDELSPESTVQDVVDFVLGRAGFAPGASQAV